jgi:hypothetical protein
MAKEADVLPEDEGKANSSAKRFYKPKIQLKT